MHYMILTVMLLWVACSGQTLREQRALLVKRGRTEYLTREHIALPPPSDFPCKVEVVYNDPVSQRVGHLEPATFDCDFPPNSVWYTHSGSPLLREDDVKLMVHHFTKTDTISRTVIVKVRIEFSPYDVVIGDNRLDPLEVGKFYGLSNRIDTNVLRFRYNYDAGAACNVHYDRQKSHLPQLGKIIDGQGENTLDSFDFDCRDFLTAGLQYKHLNAPTPETDYLPLEVEVFDPVQSDSPIKENVYLPITIRGAFPNLPPKASFTSSFMMDADEFILTTVEPSVMAARDEETPDELLVFNMSRPLGHNEGFFVNVKDHTRPITSFLQEDLVNLNIAYMPPPISFSRRKDILVEFVVYDSEFEPSQPITLHVAVRPSSTTAPRVAVNAGLTIVEGLYRPITPGLFRIADSDNLDKVKVHVRGGLHHGRLELRGRPAVVFTPSDIDAGDVIYHHDDSDDASDHIMFYVTDGSHSTRVRFPITVLPKDDSAPYLVNNLGLEVTEGGYVQITSHMLSAHDRDSDDDGIVFVLKRAPSAGELVRRFRPLTLGYPIVKFSQLEISRGHVYYHHLGGEIFSDSFSFVLRDGHRPTNRSPAYTTRVTIAAVHDMPPSPVRGTGRRVNVRETDVIVLTNDHLRYTDIESDDADLVYTISSQPFFLKSSITIDAGRIVSTDGLTTKNASVPALHTFTQRQVNYGKVAYMPPSEDIGPLRRYVQFGFSVSDGTGNKVLAQTFDITLLPVDNLPPTLSASMLRVLEGGGVKVTSNDVSAVDPDTEQEALTFAVEKRPGYGRLLLRERPLKTGDQFRLADLTSGNIRYVHGGAEKREDSFGLSVSDGERSASTSVSVRVALVDDERPVPLRQRRGRAEVDEGGSVVLTSANMAATDNDTNDADLVFSIVQSPQFGDIEVRGEQTTHFRQRDLWAKVVTYRHKDGEIGTKAKRDMVTFSVTDDIAAPISEGSVLGLNITVRPVDNAAPRVLPGGPLFVKEAGKAAITTEVLTAHDVDTSDNELVFVISKQPRWGFIENTTPDRGSERSNAGTPVDSFKLTDLFGGRVNYVQRNSSGVEPQQDHFDAYVTDPKQRSVLEKTVDVIIVPQNDELPRFELAHLTVEEGSEKVLGPRMISISDGDVPKDDLVLSVAMAPSHGQLAVLKHVPASRGPVEEPLTELTVDDLRHNSYIVYRHDGSEQHEDSFALQVSDGLHVVRKTAVVRVLAHNDEVPRLVKNRVLQADHGDSATISTRVLKATDADDADNKLYFVVQRTPEKGSVERRDTKTTTWRRLVAGNNFTQDDVDSNRVRYVHTRLRSAAKTDTFSFRLTDGTNVGADTALFRISITNVDRRLIVVNRGMSVPSGGRRVINTDMLRASDDTNRPDEIVFRLTSPPRHGQLVRPNGDAVNAFSQLDLAAQTVLYTNVDGGPEDEDSFQYDVTNSQNRSRSGVFRIAIKSLDQILPTLATNMPLTVRQAERVSLTSSNLNVHDPDTSTDRLMYVLTELPRHGRLTRDDKEVTDGFSQRDIDDGKVSYNNDRINELAMDYFLFTVSDSSHDGYLINGSRHEKPVFFSILIQPPAKQPPRLDVNRVPDSLESLGSGRYGYVLNEGWLKATHPEVGPDDLLYTIVDRPRHGYLEHTVRQRVIRRRFTQRDVEDRKVVYVLNDKTQATNDSFTFRVQDRHSNTLDSQRFVFQWSLVEFAQQQYSVCEDVGTVTLTLVRRGSLKHSAFVDIQARGRSAREYEDFVPSKITQIQFDPGMETATWPVQIKRDNLEEETEKFKVQLKNAINAVIGENDKTLLHIFNIHKGRCENLDYLTVQSDSAVPKRHAESGGEIPDGTMVSSDSSTLLVRHSLEGVKLTPKEGSSPPVERNLPRRRGGLTKEHPLKSFREERRKNRRRKHRKNGGRRAKASTRRSRSSRRLQPFADFDETTPETTLPMSYDIQADDGSMATKVAPQSCNSDSSGLLYYNMITSKMYRCNGKTWQRWGRGPINTKMLQDSASDEVTTTKPLDKASPSSRNTCPKGWNQSDFGCYKLLRSRLTWINGEARCKQAGGHLTDVTSEKHLKWLNKLVRRRPVWIGLNERQKPGRWQYTNKASTRYTNWRKNFPKRKPAIARNCALVTRRLNWVNRLCDKNAAKVVCALQRKSQSRQRKSSRWF